MATCRAHGGGRRRLEARKIARVRRMDRGGLRVERGKGKGRGKDGRMCMVTGVITITITVMKPPLKPPRLQRPTLPQSRHLLATTKTTTTPTRPRWTPPGPERSGKNRLRTSEGSCKGRTPITTLPLPLLPLLSEIQAEGRRWRGGRRGSRSLWRRLNPIGTRSGWNEGV